MSKFIVGSQNLAEHDSVYIADESGILAAVNNLVKPGYVCKSQDAKYLYAIVKDNPEELNNVNGGVAALELDAENNKLELINIKSTQGLGPTHLYYSEEFNIIITANYSGSSISLFAVNQDGSIDKEIDFHKHIGSGPNLKRQEAAHPHFVGTSQEYNLFYVVDLGMDRLLAYRYDETSRKLYNEQDKDILIPAGKGPRHYLMHPEKKNIFFVLCELSSEIVVVDCNVPKGEPLQVISMLPDNLLAESSAAAIRISPDKKFVYASNRGFDSIAVYEINEEQLKLLQIYELGIGQEHPRDLNVSQDELIVANMHSDSVQILSRDKISGKIIGEKTVLEISKPSCIELL